MATVVVFLCGVPDRSSSPVLASVISSSVRSGSISEMLPMHVVFPTPKWPTTRTFASVRTAESTYTSSRSESSLEADEYIVEELLVCSLGMGNRGPCSQKSAFCQVRQQNPYDTQRQLGVAGHLHDRQEAPGAQLQHVTGLRAENSGVARAFRRRDQGDHGEGVVGGQVATVGAHIRTD